MRSDESRVSKSCASSPDGRGVTPQSANLSQSTHKQVQVPTLVNHWRCRSVSGQTTITQQHSVQLAFFRNAALPAELCRLAASRGAVFNGIPPYDLWEHPPGVGKLPPHGSDAGSYLLGEVFGARSVTLLKDVDGLYTADPKTHPDATFIPKVRAAELLEMRLETLPIEPVVVELLTRARLVTSIRIINGLVPGNLACALQGASIGTLIYA